MPIIKWTPFLEPFEEMNKWFEDWRANLPAGAAGFMPAVDVYETEKEVVVEAPLAGVEPEKVDISIENDVLTLKGGSEKKSEVEEKNYYRKEVKTGSFYRRIFLPTPVEEDKASASSADGMLKITIPKAVTKKTKTIKVEVDKTKKKN